MAIKRKLQLSATSLQACDDCPTRFMSKYIVGIRKEGQTDGQRRGTDWHALNEVVHLREGEVCFWCVTRDKSMPDVDCPICCGEGCLKGDSIDAAIRILNNAYGGENPGKSVEEVQTMRAKLLYSLCGYKWYWNIGEEHEPIYDVIATEVPFRLSVLNPETGHPCRDVDLVGVIDKIVRMRDTGKIAQVEHKSTAEPIHDDSMYWNHLRMDTQTTLYPYATYRMQMQGELEKYGISTDDDICTKVLYDAWHVPQIKMKKLSFADTRKFVSTSNYCDEDFDVRGANVCKDGRKTLLKHGGAITVDGHKAKLLEGTKEGDTNMFETEAMYGQRVLHDIYQNPDKFFNMREIERSREDMQRFEGQLYARYQNILHMRKTGHWVQCGKRCADKYRCDYTPYCWHGEEISSDNVLEGFENMFKKGGKDG